eukprot:SAG25_NODE_101_length_15508_cov_11.653384_14_plen_88_part_00
MSMIQYGFRYLPQSYVGFHYKRRRRGSAAAASQARSAGRRWKSLSTAPPLHHLRLQQAGARAAASRCPLVLLQQALNGEAETAARGA